MEIAHQLANLNVDVIEAGFPVSSQAQFDAVQQIADSVDAELREKTINLYDKTKRFYTLSQLPVKKQEEFFSS